MADQTLLQLGPFLGVQASKDPYYLEPGFGVQASNVDTSYRVGSFSTAMGRNSFGSISLPSQYSFTCVAPLTSFSSGSGVAVAQRIYVFSASNGTTTLQGWFDPTVPGVYNTLTSLPPFTQAIQFGYALWTNGGNKVWFQNQTGTVLVDAWHLTIPSQYSYNLTGTYFSSGTPPADTYQYAITLRVSESWSITMSGGLTQLQPALSTLQESSPVFSTQIAVNGSQTPGLTSTYALSNLVTGTTPGGLTYYGCLYRWSISNPTFQFVDYLVNIPLIPDHAGSLSFQDTNATNSALTGAADLTIHNDVPPILSQTYPGLTQANNGNAQAVNKAQSQCSFDYTNPAFITKHKNCVFAFTLYPMQPLGTYPAALPTATLQPQLWWSDQGIPWAFNDDTGLVLVGPEDTPANYHPNINNTTRSLLQVPAWMPGEIEDTPMGLASTGSVLVMFKSSSTWMLLGDSAAEWQQGVRKVCDIGCVSSTSIVPAEGGVFWLAPQGVYFFNGGQPAYIGEDVRGMIESLPWNELQSAVGSYRDRTLYMSFLDVTLCYYLPTQKWYTLPFGATCAAWSSYNQNILLLGQGPTLNQIDVNPATDLGAPIVATWKGGVTDSSKPGQLKSYRFMQVVAPIQQGTAQVTLTLDPTLGTPPTYSVTFDLSKGNGSHVISLPPGMTGYEAQLSLIATTNAVSSFPMSIQKVVVTGDVKHALIAGQHDLSVVSQYYNGQQVTNW